MARGVIVGLDLNHREDRLVNRYTLHAGYLCEVDLVPELYANTALKQDIIAELTTGFGRDTRVPVVRARPGMPNRIGAQQDHQAREIVLAIIRRYSQD